MSDIDVRTKDLCRFCSKRNKQCVGVCGVQIPKNIDCEKILNEIKTHRELIEENTRMREALKHYAKNCNKCRYTECLKKECTGFVATEALQQKGDE